MDNNIIEAEWQEMKEQIALLKKTIERQDIVSDRLMRRTMKRKMRSLNREARFVYVLGAFALVYCNIVFVNMGLSLWFSLATTVFMLAAIGYTVWMHRGLSVEEISTGRLVEVGRKVARMKRMGQRWLRGVFPFLAVWFGWLGDMAVRGKQGFSPRHDCRRRGGRHCGRHHRIYALPQHAALGR